MRMKIYVDGSYNEVRQVYGGGIVLLHEDATEPIQLQVNGDKSQYRSSRNIAGELLAIMSALKAVELFKNVEALDIYYDYDGIANWATGKWKTGKEISKEYASFIRPYMSKYKISFHHVKAHTGDLYNTMADKLAKNATHLAVQKDGDS